MAGRLDPWRLEVVSKKHWGRQIDRKETLGEGKGGVDTWRIVSQQVLLAALLTTCLAISEPRKRCHRLKSSGGSERPRQQGRKVAM